MDSTGGNGTKTGQFPKPKMRCNHGASEPKAVPRGENLFFRATRIGLIAGGEEWAEVWKHQPRDT
jgi:hypothetical protein